MRQKTIYFLRHGETEYNRLHIVQGRGVDSSLNETGRLQAEAFFQAYRHVPFEAAVASSLRRTHETIAPLTEYFKLPLTKLSELDEMHWGSFEGQPTTPELHRMYDQVTREWEAGNYDFAFADGESASQLAQRLMLALEHLYARPEKVLLVCSHGRALRCLMCLMKGLPLSEMSSFHPRNTGLFLAQFNGTDFHFELENDTTHLKSLQEAGIIRH